MDSGNIAQGQCRDARARATALWSKSSACDGLDFRQGYRTVIPRTHRRNESSIIWHAYERHRRHHPPLNDGADTMSIKQAVCLMILLMVSATTSQAQEPEVARNTCSECHATQKGQLLSPNLRAPTWVEIANTPGVTEAALLVMLTTPHAGMPMFVLSPEQRQQIIDYVLSLKTRT